MKTCEDSVRQWFQEHDKEISAYDLTLELDQYSYQQVSSVCRNLKREGFIEITKSVHTPNKMGKKFYRRK